jgi:hypothetical protein
MRISQCFQSILLSILFHSVCRAFHGVFTGFQSLSLACFWLKTPACLPACLPARPPHDVKPFAVALRDGLIAGIDLMKSIVISTDKCGLVSPHAVFGTLTSVPACQGREGALHAGSANGSKPRHGLPFIRGAETAR